MTFVKGSETLIASFDTEYNTNYTASTESDNNNETLVLNRLPSTESHNNNETLVLTTLPSTESRNNNETLVLSTLPSTESRNNNETLVLSTLQSTTIALTNNNETHESLGQTTTDIPYSTVKQLESDTETKSPDSNETLVDMHQLVNQESTSNDTDVDLSNIHDLSDEKLKLHLKTTCNDSEFTDLNKWIEHAYASDLKLIDALIFDWMTSGHDEITDEFHFRDMAFETCCQTTEKQNETLITAYIENYGIPDEQEKIIDSCAKELTGLDDTACEVDRDYSNKARNKKTEKYKNASLLRRINYQIEHKIYPSNIVTNYYWTTYNTCHSAFFILWKPFAFDKCERDYRKKLLSEKPINFEKYYKFHEEISRPFKLMMQNLYSNMQTLKMSIIRVDPVISKEEIELSMTSIKNKIGKYKILNSHPMVLYYGKRAHTYRVCCGRMETDELFDQYLLYYSTDFVKMDKLLRACLLKQSKSSLEAGVVYSGDCQVAYNELSEVIKKRQSFLKKNYNQAENIVTIFQEAITLKLSEATIIKSMGIVVNQYCPDQHVLELLFDIDKLIHCEELARIAIAQNGSNNYYKYQNSISNPFLDIVIEDFKGLEQALAKIVSLPETKSIQKRSLDTFFDPNAISKLVDDVRKNASYIMANAYLNPSSTPKDTNPIGAVTTKIYGGLINHISQNINKAHEIPSSIFKTTHLNSGDTSKVIDDTSSDTSEYSDEAHSNPTSTSKNKNLNGAVTYTVFAGSFNNIPQNIDTAHLNPSSTSKNTYVKSGDIGGFFADVIGDNSQNVK
ncbi:unnamed protein product [Adineta steineri]|uniref:Uncharacterized protein n=1 Tax=Adineta steineri TaxID=433720 RepID=A0A813Z5L5_9BILA|nr:unnamed protein product [Adineta steineri]